MVERAIKPVSVTLGGLGEAAQARVASGDYGSVSEVVRAGLRALAREEAVLDAVMRERIAAALADPAPSIGQAEVFEALRAHHREG